MKQELEPLLLLIVKLKKERRVKEKKNLENWNLEKSLVNYTYPITTLPSYKHFNYSLKKGLLFRSYPGLYREIEKEFDWINRPPSILSLSFRIHRIFIKDYFNSPSR